MSATFDLDPGKVEETNSLIHHLHMLPRSSVDELVQDGINGHTFKTAQDLVYLLIVSLAAVRKIG